MATRLRPVLGMGDWAGGGGGDGAGRLGGGVVVGMEGRGECEREEGRGDVDGLMEVEGREEGRGDAVERTREGLEKVYVDGVDGMHVGQDGTRAESGQGCSDWESVEVVEGEQARYTDQLVQMEHMAIRYSNSFVSENRNTTSRPSASEIKSILAEISRRN